MILAHYHPRCGSHQLDRGMSQPSTAGRKASSQPCCHPLPASPSHARPLALCLDLLPPGRILDRRPTTRGADFRLILTAESVIKPEGRGFIKNETEHEHCN